MQGCRHARRIVGVAAFTLASLVLASPAAAATTAQDVEDAIQGLVEAEDGPPGVISVIQRGGSRRVFRAGVADTVSERPPRPRRAMRIASVSKAFSGAVALRLAEQGVLDLGATIGEVLPDLPGAWHGVELRQLLHHTSGLPDYTATPDFGPDLNASPQLAPPPIELLAYAEDLDLHFPPGSEYRYSNSDNIAVGLMVEALTGAPYEDALAAKVFERFGLSRTSLSPGVLLDDPFFHGYGGGEDVSQLVAFGGWAWASGGIVSTPLDLTRFVRGYAPMRRGPFIDGKSEPAGPGANRAGLAIFRYDTRCGTVFGHTGSILGYTQLIAANRAGTRSVTFSISTQYPAGLLRSLRRAQVDAVCFALGK